MILPTYPLGATLIKNIGPMPDARTLSHFLSPVNTFLLQSGATRTIDSCMAKKSPTIQVRLKPDVAAKVLPSAKKNTRSVPAEVNHVLRLAYGATGK